MAAKSLFLHLLSRAARAAQVIADSGLADKGLTSAQVGALFLVPAEGGASVNAISEGLGLAPLRRAVSWPMRMQVSPVGLTI